MTVPATLTLSEFLLARITEDEAAARRAISRTRDGDTDRWEVGGEGVYDSLLGTPVAVGPWGSSLSDEGAHIARWDPARVLAECEAKRRIVEEAMGRRRVKDCVTSSSHSTMHEWVDVTWVDEKNWPNEDRILSSEFTERFTEPSPPSTTLRHLALPYAAHPDYDPTWRP